MARVGIESGEELFLVFSDGKSTTMLQYPLWRQASNGFIRGPKGEKVGRGAQDQSKAEALCLEQIQSWCREFGKHGYKLLGSTASTSLKRQAKSHLNFSNNSWPDHRRLPGDLMVVGKMFWADHPDCFDVVKVVFSGGRYPQVHSELWYNPYRTGWDTDIFDDDGLPIRYAENRYPSCATIGATAVNKYDAKPRETAATLTKLINEVVELADNQYVRTEWSHDVDQLKQRATLFADSKEVIEELRALLPKLSEIYHVLGFDAQDVAYPSPTTDAYEPSLQLVAGEHTLVLTPYEIAATCHFERDEKRLMDLKKMRLEEELRQSVAIHGDIRHLEEEGEDANDE